MDESLDVLVWVVLSVAFMLFIGYLPNLVMQAECATAVMQGHTGDGAAWLETCGNF